MALIKCSECGKDVSTKADKCPHCGAPVVPPKTKKRSGCLILVGALVASFVVMVLFSVLVATCSNSSNSPVALNSYPAAKAKFEGVIAAKYAELLAFKNAGDFDGQARLVKQFENFQRLDYRDVAAIAKAFHAAESAEKRKQDSATALARLAKTPESDIKNLAAIYAQLKELHPDNSDYAAKAKRYGVEWDKQAAIFAENERREAAERAAKAAEQAKADSRKRAIEEQFSKLDGSHPALERIIKRSMHNPDSYKHVETRYSDMGEFIVVGTTFRGTNGFGAIVTNTMRAKFTLNGEFIEMLE